MALILKIWMAFSTLSIVVACGPLDPNIYYWIYNAGWSDYLGSDNTNEVLRQNTLNPLSEDQQFQVVESSLAGYHKIHHRVSGKTFAEKDGGTDVGTKVILAEDGPDYHQKLIDATGGWCAIRMKASDLNLEASSSNQPTISVVPIAPNRQFKFIPVWVACNNIQPNVFYKLWNRNSQRYMTVTGTSTGEAVITAEQESLNEGQQWHLAESAADAGFWNIISRISTLAVEVANGNAGENAEIRLWNNWDNEAQKHSFTDTSDGYCTIRPFFVDKFLEDQDPTVRTRSREIGGTQQEWMIVPVADYCTAQVTVSPAGEISIAQDIYGKGHKVEVNCTDPAYNTTGSPSSSKCSAHETWTATVLQCEKTPVAAPIFN